MRLLIAYAEKEGLRQLSGDVLASNRRMLEHCHALGFEISPDPDEPSIRKMRLKLPTGLGRSETYGVRLSLSARGRKVLGQIVIRHLSQILLQVVDDDVCHRLRKLLLKLGQHTRRSNQHELVELSALVLDVDFIGHELHEILLGSLFRIPARLDGRPSGRRAFHHSSRPVAPKLARLRMQLGRDEA